jgi:hypothetical protein
MPFILASRLLSVVFLLGRIDVMIAGEIGFL